jgi:anti-anti-sigma factor
MDIQHGRYLVAETVKPGVRALRFIRPDLSDELRTTDAVENLPVFQELRSLATTELAAGEAVVLNLALVERFSSSFYRVLLRLREQVADRSGRVLLCGLSPPIRTCLEVFKAERLFDLQPTEERAVKAVGTPPDSQL